MPIDPETYQWLLDATKKQDPRAKAAIAKMTQDEVQGFFDFQQHQNSGKDFSNRPDGNVATWGQFGVAPEAVIGLGSLAGAVKNAPGALAAAGEVAKPAALMTAMHYGGKALGVPAPISEAMMVMAGLKGLKGAPAAVEEEPGLNFAKMGNLSDEQVLAKIKAHADTLPNNPTQPMNTAEWLQSNFASKPEPVASHPQDQPMTKPGGADYAGPRMDQYLANTPGEVGKGPASPLNGRALDLRERTPGNLSQRASTQAPREAAERQLEHGVQNPAAGKPISFGQSSAEPATPPNMERVRSLQDILDELTGSGAGESKLRQASHAAAGAQQKGGIDVSGKHIQRTRLRKSGPQ